MQQKCAPVSSGRILDSVLVGSAQSYHISQSIGQLRSDPGVMGRNGGIVGDHIAVLGDSFHIACHRLRLGIDPLQGLGHRGHSTLQTVEACVDRLDRL